MVVSRCLLCRSGLWLRVLSLDGRHEGPLLTQDILPSDRLQWQPDSKQSCYSRWGDVGAMLTWAQTCHVTLRLIEPGKPNQNAYIESFNRRLRDECLNRH